MKLHGNVPLFAFMRFPVIGPINDYAVCVLTKRITVRGKNEATDTDSSADKGRRKSAFQIPYLPHMNFLFLPCTSPSLSCAPLHSFQTTSLSHYLHLYFTRSNSRGPTALISFQHHFQHYHVLYCSLMICKMIF